MTEVLRRAAPSEAGVDARGLLGFLDALETDAGIRPHGLVVLRDGARLVEGAWAPYSADRVQLLYSLSKSFTSTAAGLARAEGLLDLDATVLSYFPELDADIRDPRSRAMRVRDIAAMASGHRGETLDRALQLDAADLVRGFLLVPPDEEPGTVFAYNQPCTYTLAAIVERVTGARLVDYLRPRLFDPLGIGEVAWIEDPPGRTLGFSGLHATVDAVARLGELYRRGGLWGEERILDEDWVRLATTSHVVPPPGGGPDWEVGYGFQFWMARHGYRGDGAYGQFCAVLPEQRLVVAMTSETENMQRVLDALWRHVLPAVDRPGDPAADAELAARLAGLALAAPGSAPVDPGVVGRSFGTDDGSRRATGVTEVRVAEAGRLELVEPGATLEVRFGAGSWVTGASRGVPVAASGGATADGGLEVEVLLLETPHTLRVRCDPGGSAVVRWVTTPLHAGAPSVQRAPWADPMA